MPELLISSTLRLMTPAVPTPSATRRVGSPMAHLHYADVLLLRTQARLRAARSVQAAKPRDGEIM